MLFGSPSQIIYGLGITLVVLVVIVSVITLVLRMAFRGRGVNGALHAELVRIDERLTSIEKTLKDIN